MPDHLGKGGLTLGSVHTNLFTSLHMNFETIHLMPKDGMPPITSNEILPTLRCSDK